MDGEPCTNYTYPEINNGDNAFMMAMGALVFLMTPGLGFFYGGLMGSSNVLNTINMNIGCGCLVIIHWLIFGYSFAFGSGSPGYGSFEKIGLMGVSNLPNVATAPTITEYTFVIYEMTFAMITPALMSGAISGRLKFRSWIIFILLWSTVVYDLVAHWLWASWVSGYTMQDGVCTAVIENGWLKEMGALDFAGGAVVHITSGFSALTAAIYLGPRKTPHDANKPHNVPLMLIGTAMLWFGWFGFNGGSALEASGDGIAGLAILNSNIAAATAYATWAVLDVLFKKRSSVLGANTGAIVGLATITPAAGYVSPASSLAFGFVPAIAGYFMVKLKEQKLHYDDVLDVFACHGLGGALGILMLGLFSEKSLNATGADGGFWGNGYFFGIQLLVIAVVGGTSIILTLLILIILKYLPGFGLRPDEEKELKGMDFAAHREVPYRWEEENIGVNGNGHEKGHDNDVEMAPKVKPVEQQQSQKGLLDD